MESAHFCSVPLCTNLSYFLSGRLFFLDSIILDFFPTCLLLKLPFQGCVVEMEQRCAVFATVEADTDLLCRILIQGGLYGFQCKLHFLTQRCACGTKTTTSRGSFTLKVIQLCQLRASFL